MISTTPRETYRLRSFVRRDGRKTAAQERAREALWPQIGLDIQQGMLDMSQVFGRVAPCYLEIGFGMGTSLLAAAKQYPEANFIGVETHKPGIGALCLGMQTEAITNIRISEHDVVDVLEKTIPAASLDGVQIFFPDPWPKRRHHPRRLIQPAFVAQLLEKLKMGGSLHLATDWEHYAKHMMKVLSAETRLTNTAGVAQFAPRSPFRPVITKFEQRAIKDGRSIWELQFVRC